MVAVWSTLTCDSHASPHTRLEVRSTAEAAHPGSWSATWQMLWGTNGRPEGRPAFQAVSALESPAADSKLQARSCAVICTGQRHRSGNEDNFLFTTPNTALILGSDAVPR